VSDARDVLSTYRRTGEASAARAEAGLTSEPPIAGAGAAFFDVDNTVMRGASIFHFAVGLARHKYFSGREILGFGVKQLKFVMSGSEDLEDMASATEAALSFVEGRRVDELMALGEQVFDEIMVDKLIPGTLAMAQGHLDAGQQVWLVTATPVELATVIARRLGLTGALGTVAEVKDGIYTGRLDGSPLHGLAKAEAVRAIAAREGLDLAQCSAYSDSSNDIPMLSVVGNPVAVNPDSALLAHARANDWKIRDFRRREQVKRVALPAAAGIGGIAVGIAIGYAGAAARRVR
jgi:HAD superfamily hydrolase (TIGR01490 family)